MHNQQPGLPPAVPQVPFVHVAVLPNQDPQFVTNLTQAQAVLLVSQMLQAMIAGKEPMNAADFDAHVSEVRNGQIFRRGG